MQEYTLEGSDIMKLRILDYIKDVKEHNGKNRLRGE